MTEKFKELCDHVAKLKLLLDDLQLGMLSWCMMYAEHMKFIVAYWQENGEPKSPDVAGSKVCEWTFAGNSGGDDSGRVTSCQSFRTACGRIHWFMMGQLEDRFNFCPYCGKPIQALTNNSTTGCRKET